MAVEEFGKIGVNVDTIIEQGYQQLQVDGTCNSMLKRYLPPALLAVLRTRTTKLGGTIWDCIASGCSNLDNKIGVYACDAEAYQTFSQLFTPIINEYHHLSTSSTQPKPNMGEGQLRDLKIIDMEEKYIVSSRIRVARNIAGIAFSPLMTEDDYQAVEQKTKDALEMLPDKDLIGTYQSLGAISETDKQKLIKEHFLFEQGDRFMQAAKANRCWPVGRGLYWNTQKTFLVWVNEEDHIRLISMQAGGNIRQVWDRLIRAIRGMQKTLQFWRDNKLGYLTFCPTNLGTGLRASVHIRLPKLSKKPNFEKICEDLQLEVRSTRDECTAAESSVVDISNKRRLGLSEWDAVKVTYDGVKKLIELEEKEP